MRVEEKGRDVRIIIVGPRRTLMVLLILLRLPLLSTGHQGGQKAGRMCYIVFTTATATTSSAATADRVGTAADDEQLVPWSGAHCQGLLALASQIVCFWILAG